MLSALDPAKLLMRWSRRISFRNGGSYRATGPHESSISVSGWRCREIGAPGCLLHRRLPRVHPPSDACRDDEQKQKAEAAALFWHDLGRRCRQIQRQRPVEIRSGAIVHVPPCNPVSRPPRQQKQPAAVFLRPLNAFHAALTHIVILQNPTLHAPFRPMTKNQCWRGRRHRSQPRESGGPTAAQNGIA